MKPAASISLDLDNLWSYLKTQGAPGWESFPCYLDQVVPRILETLDRCGQRITFFIVGQDATMESNRVVLKSIAAAGHEIANHSFMHEPWLHLYSREQIQQEIRDAENAIAAVTGQTTHGFRGPGFSTSPLVREVLSERGYAYDASSFPSALGPVARLFFFLNSRLSADEKAQRKGLYGRFSDAFGPLQPFVWENGLVEVPVTTMPLLRLPIHTTYLMFLAQKSEWLAKVYWNTAVTLCRVRGVAPSLLLHPTDFLDVQDVPQMSFFPGMKLPAKRKISLVEHMVRSLQRYWQVGTMSEHAAAFTEASVAPPHFSKQTA
ncbi:MAG: polysaccharide deacetylase family protein [Prosthecobacter sp.]|uniref:polysaccharide deacetylase family protein n=1 Tax=Prosthecobacter sp. TaxID=1965333 RepID=UPI002601179B|nr:polysaccharide deacetylase family protein [Prosthecobacter sp.]MCF7787848.1 polysaccharide deacetylase family protein [Prosthecobacter sp.]